MDYGMMDLELNQRKEFKDFEEYQRGVEEGISSNKQEVSKLMETNKKLNEQNQRLEAYYKQIKN